MRIIKALALIATILISSQSGYSILSSNAVIIDQAPFYSAGPEDMLGVGNYALSNSGFIDIPYAIFDLENVDSISSATLTWNFIDLYVRSSPAEIALFVGNDSDGLITTSDRSMGAAINSFTYVSGEQRSYDVTDELSASLALGQYFAARLEVVDDPSTISALLGGDFEVPSLSYVEFVSKPESPRDVPDSIATINVFGIALFFVFVASRKFKRR